MSEESGATTNQNDYMNFKVAHHGKNKQKFYLDAETADVQFVFIVDGKRKKVPAHKLILANESDVFHVMFYGKWKKEEEIHIKGVSVDAFKEFLKFIYCDDVTITKKNVADMMKLADMYDVAECVDICETFMKKMLPIEDICLSLQSAIDYNRGELKKFCEKRISEQPAAVFASERFLSCSQDVLKYILEIDSLLCDPVDVFNACIRWAKEVYQENRSGASTENLRGELGDCLYLIPFHLMKPYQVMYCVNAYKDLFDKDELVEMINMMASDVPTQLNKFKLKAPAGQWEDVYAIEKLYARALIDKGKYWIKQCEVTTVNTCQTFLLRALDLFGIQHVKFQVDNKNTGKGLVLKGTLAIVLKTDGEEDTVLLKQHVSIECQAFLARAEHIRLVKPIVLEANKQYEARITFGSNWADQTFYNANEDSYKYGIVDTIYYVS